MPNRQLSSRDETIEFVTRLDGSINPAFDTRLKITATHETRPGELGVIAATPLHARYFLHLKKQKQN